MWINLNNIGIDAREVVAVLVVDDTVEFSGDGKRRTFGNSEILLKDGRIIRCILKEEACFIKDAVCRYHSETGFIGQISCPTPEEIEKASKTS